MVLEWRRERNRTDGGFDEVAVKLGVHPESVRNWLKRRQVDAGARRTNLDKDTLYGVSRSVSHVEHRHHPHWA